MIKCKVCKGNGFVELINFIEEVDLKNNIQWFREDGTVKVECHACKTKRKKHKKIKSTIKHSKP